MGSSRHAPIEELYGDPHDYWGKAPTLEDAPDDVGVDEDDRRRRRELAAELTKKDVWPDGQGAR